MHLWKHHRSKPVIGIAGGIGSGKSTICRLFASLGCAVIDSDALAHNVLQTTPIKTALRAWLGPAVFHPDGSVNRPAVAHAVFTDPQSTARLNALIHPQVAQRRADLMTQYLADPAIRAILWDSPLLFETGLNHDCDAVIFVDVPRPIRLQRLQYKAAWTSEDLDRREKLQFPLDKKAFIADYCIDNSGDQASSLRQVQQVLSQLLTSTP